MARRSVGARNATLGDPAAGHPGPHEPYRRGRDVRPAVCRRRVYRDCRPILYAFARTESLAAEIEDNFALHLSIVAGQIAGVPVVHVMPIELR
jgi:hypothetical protein